MGYLKSATHERKLKGANTILVGPGLTYETIAAGIAAAVAGGAVLVMPGTYAESVSKPSTVRLEAMVPGTVTITGTVEVI